MLEWLFGEVVPTGKIDAVVIAARWRDGDADKIEATLEGSQLLGSPLF